MTERFYKIAAKFGHSREILEKGIAIRSTLTVNNADELREVLDDGMSKAGRETLDKSLFNGIPLTSASDASSPGITRRVEEFLFGNADLSEANRARIKPSFPAPGRGGIESQSNHHDGVSTHQL